MKTIKFIISGGWVVVICLLFSQLPPIVWSAEDENHCFTCHTNPRKLIEITREISKLNSKKPGASKETKGEG
jgi:hypothetical protein